MEETPTGRFAKVRAMLGARRHRGVVAMTAAVVAALVLGGVALAATNISSSAPETPTTLAPQPPLSAPDGSVPVGSVEEATSTTLANGATTSIVTTTSTTGAPSVDGTTTTAPSLSPTTSTTTATNVAPVTTSTTAAATTTTVVGFERQLTVTTEDDSDSYLPTDPTVAIIVNAADNGGYVSEISVIWEAGSTAMTKTYPLSSCSAGPNGRVSSAQSQRFTHQYSSANTYRVTVSVSSTDCQGNNARTRYAYPEVTSGGTSTPV